MVFGGPTSQSVDISLPWFASGCEAAQGMRYTQRLLRRTSHAILPLQSRDGHELDFASRTRSSRIALLLLEKSPVAAHQDCACRTWQESCPEEQLVIMDHGPHHVETPHDPREGESECDCTHRDDWMTPSLRRRRCGDDGDHLPPIPPGGVTLLECFGEIANEFVAPPLRRAAVVRAPASAAGSCRPSSFNFHDVR
jgi:hypothetical protein